MSYETRVHLPADQPAGQPASQPQAGAPERSFLPRTPITAGGLFHIAVFATAGFWHSRFLENLLWL